MHRSDRNPAGIAALAADPDAPFAVAGMPHGEDLAPRIHVDKNPVDVFANGRHVMAAADNNTRANGRDAFSRRADTTFKKFEIRRLKPAKQRFLVAMREPAWKVDDDDAPAW